MKAKVRPNVEDEVLRFIHQSTEEGRAVKESSIIHQLREKSKLKLTAPVITKVVNELLERGFIVRVPSDEYEHGFFLALTPQGRLRVKVDVFGA